MRIDMLDLQQHSMENHRAQIVHYQIDLDIHNDLEDTHDRYTIGGNTHTHTRQNITLTRMHQRNSTEPTG
jgi:hypothetical protein